MKRKDSIWVKNNGYFIRIFRSWARQHLSIYRLIRHYIWIQSIGIVNLEWESNADRNFQSDFRGEQTWFHNKLRQSTPITRNAWGNERGSRNRHRLTIILCHFLSLVYFFCLSCSHSFCISSVHIAKPESMHKTLVYFNSHEPIFKSHRRHIRKHSYVHIFRNCNAYKEACRFAMYENNENEEWLCWSYLSAINLAMKIQSNSIWEIRLRMWRCKTQNMKPIRGNNQFEAMVHSHHCHGMLHSKVWLCSQHRLFHQHFEMQLFFRVGCHVAIINSKFFDCRENPAYLFIYLYIGFHIITHKSITSVSSCVDCTFDAIYFFFGIFPTWLFSVYNLHISHCIWDIFSRFFFLFTNEFSST